MAGYHLFSTGEVLTAANVNDYVMKQTVMVFASAAARTTALSGVLREGMISYRTDSHITEYYNGSAWATLGSILTTKGDLATFDTSSQRLAVGTDGQTLVANSTVSTGLKWIGGAYVAKTASYTFASGDEGNIFSMNNAATQQFNIPTDATFNFAVGTEINVFWITGAGQPTIGAVTPGTTTVISTGATSATPKLRVANSGATCKKLAANSWIVFGDIA